MAVAAEGIRTGAMLQPAAAFGLDVNVENNIHYVDENKIVFPAGRHLCCFNMESRDMSFMLENDKVEQITLMCVSQNKKYLALIEILHEGGFYQFSIFNLQTERRVRTLMLGSEVCKSGVMTTLAFSSCGKFLLVQNGAPDWMLTCWRWYNGKMTSCAEVGQEVNCVSFCPTDSTIAITTGPKLLYLWKIDKNSELAEGSNLVPGNREFKGTYTHHTWLPNGQLAIATSLGKILLFEGKQVKGVVPAAEEGLGIISLHPMTRGFLCITISGELLLYEVSLRSNAGGDGEGPGELTEKGLGYQLAKRFRVDMVPRFGSVSTTEEQMMFSSQLGDLGTLTFSHLEDGMSEEPFELMCRGFHKGPITGMDVCTQRPLLVTCGADKTVRIWNYLDKSCRLFKQLSEDVQSVAIHPSGFYLLAGMADKLRLFNVAHHDLVQLREFHIPACPVVRFSNGGHLFAAVNKTVIQVYSTYAPQSQAQVLKGHSAVVSDLCWAPSDLTMASCSISGEVYEWKLDSMTRDHAKECVQKFCHYNTVTYNHTAQAIVAAGSDNKIKHMVAGNVEFEALVVPEGEVNICEVAMGRDDRMLMAATDAGAVRSYFWTANPTMATPQDGTFHEYWLHHYPTTHLALSYDQNFVFSTDENGTIYMCDVQFIVEGKLTEKVAVERGYDLTVISREELEEQAAARLELKGRLESVVSQMEYKMMIKDSEWREQVGQLNLRVKELQESEARNAGELARMREIMSEEMNKRVLTLERAHMQAAEELENLYEKKLAKESRRFAMVQQTMNDKLFQSEEKRQIVEEEHREEKRLREEQFASELRAETDKHIKLEDEKQDLKNHAEELLLQTEEDCDTDIENVKRTFGAQYAEAYQIKKRLTAENALLQRGMDKLHKELEEKNAQVKQKEEDKHLLGIEIHDLEEIVEDLRLQVLDRNQMIDDKEQAISTEKIRVKDLEKQKFVLNYKVTSMQEQTAPRERKLDSLQDKLKDMDKDLQGQMHSLQKQKHYCSDVNNRMQAVSTEVKALRQMVRDRDIYIQGFSHDLDRVMEMPHGRREGQREEALRYLHRVYVHNLEKPASGKEDPGKMELMQQHEYLEKKNRYLARKVEHAEYWKQHIQNKSRVENSKLLRDLADMNRTQKNDRHEIAYLKNNLKEIETKEFYRKREGAGGVGGGGSPSRASKEKMPQRVEEEVEEPLDPQKFGPGGFTNGETSRPASGRAAGVSPGGVLIRGNSSRAINELVSMERERINELVAQLEHQHGQMEEQKREIENLRIQVNYYTAGGTSGSDPPTVYWDYSDKSHGRPDSGSMRGSQKYGTNRPRTAVSQNARQYNGASNYGSKNRPFSALHTSTAPTLNQGSGIGLPPAPTVSIHRGASPGQRPQTAAPFRGKPVVKGSNKW